MPRKNDQGKLASTSGPAMLHTVDEARSATEILRFQSKSIGFCPTMGGLHEGHVSLMKKAIAENDVCLLSIFVNPLQFAHDEDLENYPRDLEADTKIAASAGAEMIFAPKVSDIYPQGRSTRVSVPEITRLWEGSSRPDHFDGVTTVVAKLFNIVGPCRAYFGQKDFQQLAVVRQLVKDMSFPIEIVECPTVRETDGLALSSRNAYLSPSDRAAAPVLYQALQKGAAAIKDGQLDPLVVASRIADAVSSEHRVKLDYAAAVDPQTLQTPERLGAHTQLLVAGFVGQTRLIDNISVHLDET